MVILLNFHEYFNKSYSGFFELHNNVGIIISDRAVKSNYLPENHRK